MSEEQKNSCVSEEIKPKIKHDWYQTESQVVVTILIKNALSDQVKVQYNERSLSFSCPLPNSDSEYSLELELAHEIIPTMCSYVVSPSKIEIKLRKKEGLRWNQLEGEGTEKKVKAIPQAVIDASGPQQPPQLFRKDWNKIEKDIKKMEEEEKPEGDAALNALFRKIYGEGSDEVRRAMNKSFVESGGTVLSTNWTQVAQDKVEVKPPDGLEFRKWDS
ncbi:protein SGT1 homolog isoform X2 [Bombyx mandarina]|uniref:Protein SGT1 homolog isoform X1 n=1 Tax=Bombyx mandarina TaxID=7092 RepID=A0A6J2JPQ3_BOMMA|nr:protein SGT1 homolog isoform X1 [Bombyx mandarina]XP_028031690.1 protein SGT1 homolog isoform X1 [Bombyx mandarina]XP_028031691.1 protein SGT1 homolog isoform X2 [Bombyx mandarina]